MCLPASLFELFKTFKTFKNKYAPKCKFRISRLLYLKKKISPVFKKKRKIQLTINRLGGDFEKEKKIFKE